MGEMIFKPGVNNTFSTYLNALEVGTRTGGTGDALLRLCQLECATSGLANSGDNVWEIAAASGTTGVRGTLNQRTLVFRWPYLGHAAGPGPVMEFGPIAANAKVGMWQGASGTTTSGTNYNSYVLGLDTSYWNGSAASYESIFFTAHPDSGTNPVLHLQAFHDCDASGMGHNYQMFDLSDSKKLQFGTFNIFCSTGPSLSSVTLDASGVTSQPSYTLSNYGGSPAVFVGQITTTSAASDNLTVTGVTATSSCGYFATNATASTMTGLYVTVSANTVTLNHCSGSSCSGGTFNIQCGGQ